LNITHTHYNPDRQTSTFYEDGKTVSSFEGYMAGGICWPMTYESRDNKTDFSGFAVMCAQDVETKVVHVIAQRKFAVVDSIFDPQTHQIEYQGIVEWFNKVRAGYFAGKYYYHQDKLVASRYYREVILSPMIQLKPMFVEVEWSDDDEALMTVWKYVTPRRLNFHIDENGTQLVDELELIKMGDKSTFPSVHALVCCLNGIDKKPWRQP
jgi:hypothetical protein